MPHLPGDRAPGGCARLGRLGRMVGRTWGVMCLSGEVESRGKVVSEFKRTLLVFKRGQAPEIARLAPGAK